MKMLIIVVHFFFHYDVADNRKKIQIYKYHVFHGEETMVNLFSK